MTDPDIEELRQQSSPGQRSEGNDKVADLVDALADERIAVADGDASGQISIRDSRLVSLVNVLDRDEYDDEYQSLITSVESEVDSKPDLEEGTKAYLLALLARAGLQEVAPVYDEKLTDAITEFAQRRM